MDKKQKECRCPECGAYFSYDEADMSPAKRLNLHRSQAHRKID